MNIIRSVAVMAASGILLAGCGSQAVDTQTISQGVESTTTTAAPTSTTTMPPTTTTTMDPRIIIRELSTKDGWRYRITITPASPDADPTPDGCVELARPGQTNIRWTMVVENLLTDRSAPWPSISTALNLNSDGTAVDKRVTSAFAAISLKPEAFHGVDIAPNGMSLCYLRGQVWSGGVRDQHLIDPGGNEQFMIVAGPVAEPIPVGTQLLADIGEGPSTQVPAQ